MANSNSISCGERLDITQVESLKATLVNHLTPGTEITLIADQVERADTAGLQLLVSFLRTAAKQNITCQWQGVSTPLQDAADLLGLSTALQISKK